MAVVTRIRIPLMAVAIRAGSQNEKWSNRQNTSDPTGSIHRKAREKSLTPKKLIAFENNGPCSLENGAKISKKYKMTKNHFSRADLGS